MIQHAQLRFGVLQRAAILVEAHPRREFDAPRRGVRPLPHQLRQARQRFLEAHGQEIHGLLRLPHDLQRIAQARRPRRAVEPVAPARRRRFRA